MAVEQQDRDDEARDGAGDPDEIAGDLSPTGELLAYLARGLVDRPEEVAVEQFEEDGGALVLELSVGDEDYGKVIGRGGRTAHALRTVVRAAATHEKRRVLIDIVD
jgi:uncharacterized protein